MTDRLSLINKYVATRDYVIVHIPDYHERIDNVLYDYIMNKLDKQVHILYGTSGPSRTSGTSRKRS